MIDDDIIIRLYDTQVSTSTDGSKVAEAKAAIRSDVRTLIERSARDLDSETDMAIDRAVDPIRDRRSRNLKRDLDYLLEAFTDPENGVYIDPLLSQAYRLGDERGTDKSLRNWTAENFTELVVTRYRVAAQSKAAASDLDRTVQRVTGRMREHDASTLGTAVAALAVLSAEACTA